MEIILFDLSSVVSALAILSHLCLQMFLFTTSVQYAEYITLMANLIFPFSIAAPLSAHSFVLLLLPRIYSKPVPR